MPGVESNIQVTFINVLKQQIPAFFSQYSALFHAMKVLHKGKSQISG